MSGGHGRFIEHGGKRMYVIDLAGLPAEEIFALLPSLAADIRGEPRGSLLTITCLEGVTVSKLVLEKLKEFMAGNARHVKAAALVGLSPFQRALARIAAVSTGRTFHLADTVEEAKEHLAREGR